jgi:hypothetical protein
MVDLKYRTIEELMKTLGLDPHFTQHPQAAGCQDARRGSGRTTQMLLRALLAAQSEAVLVIGSCPRHSRLLTDQMLSMAKQSGIDTANICQHATRRSARGSRCLIFEDHHHEYI